MEFGGRTVNRDTFEAYIAICVLNTSIYSDKGKDDQYWNNDTRQRQLHYELMIQAGFGAKSQFIDALDRIQVKRKFETALREHVTQEYIKAKRKERLG